LETNEKQSIELPLKTKDKVPLWVRADIEADHDETGAVVQWRMVLIDISLQRQAEEDRKNLHDQLMQAQKMESIGNLAGGIAHDFNNILSSVMGFAEISLEEVEQGSNLEDNLHEIFTAGKRAKDLVSEIMTFSRQTNEQVKPVHIGTVVKESNHLLRLSLPSNIIIKQKLNSDEMVMGNYALLQQVLLNLVNNAADVMEDNGGAIDVTVSDIIADESFARKSGLGAPGNYVKITVADTGEGIPPETIKSIFEPYFTTKETGKGTGLGLATVQGTVKKYGGTITAESKPGKGTVFTVLLPATKKPEHTKPDETEDLPHGSERILFVDDEVSIVKINHQILAGLGYNVTARTSSIEALEIFQSNPNDFDLVITDMTMPNLTGDKLATELMKIRPDIPVMICTGYSKNVSSEKASELGIRAFAYKPLERADLAKMIRKVLDEDKL
jgi:signal transduction histidine kinase/CheY-like chemotaxis protein